MRQWYQWALSLVPHPINELEPFLPYVDKSFLRIADDLAEQRRALASPAFADLLASRQGKARLFLLLVRELQPLATDQEIEALFRIVSVDALFVRASGKLPRDDFSLERECFAGAGLIPPLAGKGSSKPLDWLTVDKHLFTNFNLTPQQVDAMTITEIAALCQERDKLPDDALIEHGKTYGKLSIEQLFALAILKYAD